MSFSKGQRKADSTLRTSRAVPHPSTNRALCRLSSEVERDPVHSTRYGRQRHVRFGKIKAEVIANFASAHQKPSSGSIVMHPVIHFTCRCDLRLLVLAQHSSKHPLQRIKFRVPKRPHSQASQCSLHNAPIFRLLLKVAVNGTHQCESQNFCGALCPNMSAASVWPAALV